ncbi:polyprenyl synthetase family protein [Streptomyces sp. NBC_00322]|uniref:polyprenyl synthetase family protein n=1 Tax=Streptomyces sp. NBC_00322 TaxID=2975712 RepID=UPI002E2A9B7C|nr:polyprenyl synthetase family protein [Streptomyces sp. NBC_00322]
MSTHVTLSTGSQALLSPRVVRSTVLPVIQQQVSVLEPTLVRICGYHLGFIDEHGDPSSGGDGKLTRASLMMAVADGVGLRPEDVQSQAAAVELLHNATLLHDDIADADELRRGRPAAWKVFGVSLAIHAGNALQALGLRIVVDDSGPGHKEIASSFAEALGLVHAGQARELTLRPGPGASIAAYEQIVKEKASALLEFSLATPAMRAGKPENVLAALRDAGRHLGIALQISNDVEDIWGDPAVTGKPIRGDIKRRNLTFPVLAAWSADNPASDQLSRLWHADSITAAHLQALADLIDEAGGRDSAQRLSRRHLDSAVEHLGRAGLSPTATAELTTLFNRIVNRAA